MSELDSRFLPKNFDPKKGIVLIAGKNQYPVLLANEITKRGIPLYLIAFKGETESSLVASFDSKNRTVIKVGQLGKLLRNLQKWRTPYAIMAGQITPKKLFRGLQPDLKALSVLRKLKEKNAESIFGAIGDEMAKIGVNLLDARCYMDNFLVTFGQISGRKFRLSEEHLQFGIDIAEKIADLNVGQGIVMQNGTVLSVEAFEGTDKMLERSKEFTNDQACFIKTTKAKADFRFDIPVFGIKTLEKLKQSGILQVALKADQTIILEKYQVLQKATAWGIAIRGY